MSEYVQQVRLLRKPTPLKFLEKTYQWKYLTWHSGQPSAIWLRHIGHEKTEGYDVEQRMMERLQASISAYLDKVVARLEKNEHHLLGRRKQNEEKEKALTKELDEVDQQAVSYFLKDSDGNKKGLGKESGVSDGGNSTSGSHDVTKSTESEDCNKRGKLGVKYKTLADLKKFGEENDEKGDPYWYVMDDDDDDDEDDGDDWSDSTIYSLCEGDPRADPNVVLPNQIEDVDRTSEYSQSDCQARNTTIHCQAGDNSDNTHKAKFTDASDLFDDNAALAQMKSATFVVHPDNISSLPPLPSSSPTLSPPTDRTTQRSVSNSSVFTSDSTLSTSSQDSLSSVTSCDPQKPSLKLKARIAKMSKASGSPLIPIPEDGILMEFTDSIAKKMNPFSDVHTLDLTEKNLKQFDLFSYGNESAILDSDSDDSDNESNDSGETASTISASSFAPSHGVSTRTSFGSCKLTKTNFFEGITFDIPPRPKTPFNCGMHSDEPAKEPAKEVVKVITENITTKKITTEKIATEKVTTEKITKTRTATVTIKKDEEDKPKGVTILTRSVATFDPNGIDFNPDLAPNSLAFYVANQIDPSRWRLTACDWVLIPITVRDMVNYPLVTATKHSTNTVLTIPLIVVTAPSGDDHYTLLEPITSKIGLDYAVLLDPTYGPNELTASQTNLLEHITARNEAQEHMKEKFEQWDLHGKRASEFFRGRGINRYEAGAELEAQCRKESRAADAARDWWATQQEEAEQYQKVLMERFGDQMREFKMV